MARAYRRGAYRMTASRRAALRKAQAASAKKRSRNKKVKIAAAGTAVVGVGVLGYKYGGNTSSIANNLKARTPKATRRRINIFRSKLSDAVYPITKEANRIKNGLTRGVKSGAGPDAGAKKPRPAGKRTNIPQPDAEEMKNIRDALAADNYRRTAQGRQEAKGYNKEDNSINQRFIGMPRIRGRKVDQATARKYIDRLNKQRTAMGLNAYTDLDATELINRFMAEGSVRKPRRGRRKRKK